MRAGPILTVMAERSFDRVYLFSTPKAAEISDRTATAIMERHPGVTVEILEVPLKDPTNSRNCKNGSIRRAGRGLYHLPRYDPALGVLGPSYEAMQDLIQRKAGGDVFPTGAHAANVLGLSDQVPMRCWHLTTGPSRRIRRGKSEIVLRHVSPRFVSTKNPKSAQVILAHRVPGAALFSGGTHFPHEIA